MFTGIIEEMGRVLRISQGTGGAKLWIRAQKVLEQTKVGDSIAVNGVCLTVTDLSGDGFVADVMAETLRRSSLGSLKTGSAVNLERAMAAEGRFGGHLVSGHIDGTGTIIGLQQEDNAIWVRISATKGQTRYIVEKGSITIDGVSLTVATVGETDFQVCLIPHTAKETILLSKGVGGVVNLETDLIGKYVEKLMKPAESDKTGREARGGAGEISADFLRKYEF